MVKRALALVGCLLLSATLFSLTAASKLYLTQPSPGEVIISVDPSLHQEFGLSYPVTYKLTIPAGSSSLNISVKYQETAAWTPLAEKTSSDYFNGEQVVRFDYAANLAYVSVGFDGASDDIFLRATDGAGQPVAIAFQGVCRYYDNRNSVVTISADDWKDFTNTAFVQSVHHFRSYNLPITVAIITGGTTTPTWQVIQSELDSGLVEAASHTRSHVNPPYPDPISEIIGSKQDLLANLTMPPAFRKGSQGYVYTWIAPYGSTTSQTELYVSQARYLVDRMTFISTGDFSAWDSTQRRYLMDGMTVEMGPFWGGITDLNTLNSKFDQSMSAGTIYHLMLHPQILADSGYWYKPWTTGHLAHISNRTNVWYTNLGTLYVYHLLQDGASGSTEVVSGAPAITGQPVSMIAHWRETATFSVAAIGSAPLTYQWRRNGADIPGATGAIYTTPALAPADSNTLYACVVTNGFGSATSNSATLTVIPPNILTNPSFESGTSPWVFWTNGSGTLTQAPFGTDGSKSGQATITVPGTSTQLYQAGLTLQPNTGYRLTFDAYSSSGHDLEVNLIKNASPFTNYGLGDRRFDLGTNWQSFSVTFTTTGFSSTVTDGRLWFSLAPYGTAGDVYHIDNVRLARVSDLYPPDATPPLITAPPTEQTVLAGQSATFTISATGTAPLSYQWQRNNTDITGASGSSYTTPATTAADSGAIYRCYVGNNYGSVASANVRLTVITPRPPVIFVQPHDTTVQEGNSAEFTVAATGDTVLLFQWQKNGTTIAGATTPLYRIASASREDSGAAFRCIVSNPAGKDTSGTAILYVRPIPPTQYLASPVTGDSNLAVSPVLVWHRTAGASCYQLQVSTDSAFTVGLVVNDSTITDTSRQVHALTFVTRYYWRVKAMGTGGQFSATWTFTTTIGPAATPTLVSPVNGASGLPTLGLTFRWQSVASATRYGFQLGTDSTFSTGVFNSDTALVDTASTVNGLTAETRYFWRVRAHNPAGWAGFSPFWSLTTVTQAPGRIALHGPLPSALATADSGTFTWFKPTPRATQYWFEISVDSTFSAQGFTDSTLTDTVKVFRPLQDGQYFWRVRGWNAGGWGLFSETRAIRVVLNAITEQTGVPQTFILEQNHPNPFNPATTIGFGLPSAGQVRLEVYNLLGERIAVVLDDHLQPGYRSVTFGASNLPSGVYIYRLVTQKGALVRKMILMK